MGAAPATGAADAGVESAPLGRRPRALLTVHAGARSGATLMALAEARHLAASYQLTIAVREGPLRAEFSALGEVVDGPPSLPIWSDSQALWGRRALRTARDTAALTRCIRSRAIDVVVTNSSVSLSPVLAARLCRVPAVVHGRDTPFSRFAPWLMRAHVRLADVVIVNSAHNARLFEAHARARIVRIPDGIPMPSPRAERGVAFGSPLRLAVVGTLTPEKGQDVAVAALAALGRRGVDASLDLVGPVARADHAAELRALAGRLGVAQRVRFRGETASIDEALAGADVLLLPSRGESAGLVAMEALARDTPVIASDVGGVPEVVRHGETGLLVPVGDAEAFAGAIVAMTRDPEWARELTARGREDMAARFALDATLPALQAELDRLVADGARRRGR